MTAYMDETTSPDQASRSMWFVRTREWRSDQLLPGLNPSPAEEARAFPLQQRFSGRPCLAEAPWRDFDVFCTRSRGHGGRHAAGDGSYVIAVWRNPARPARDAGRASLGALIALMLAVVAALAVSVVMVPPAGADGRTVLAVVLALVALAVLPAASRRRGGVGR